MPMAEHLAIMLARNWVGLLPQDELLIAQTCFLMGLPQIEQPRLH
jgi:hypothetical protein